MSDPLIIYHGGCDDGFGAAFAAYRALITPAVTPELFAGRYQVDPPYSLARDRYVYIVDFSYKAAEMRKLANVASSVTVLDHHATAQMDLEPLLESGEILGEFDMNRCGAVMTYQWFNGNKSSLPEFYKFLQIRDLWQEDHELWPSSRAFTMALRTYPQDLEVWAGLLGKVEQLINDGQAIIKWFDQRVNDIVHHARMAQVGSKQIPIVNSPVYFCSEVGQKMSIELNNGGPAASYWQNKDGTWTFSIRAEDASHNAHLWASEEFGGGGHPKSCGFRVKNLADALTELEDE